MNYVLGKMELNGTRFHYSTQNGAQLKLVNYLFLKFATWVRIDSVYISKAMDMKPWIFSGYHAILRFGLVAYKVLLQKKA